MEGVFAYWPIGVTFVGLTVWLVRLEAIIIEKGKDINRLWDQRKEDMDAAQRSRSETNAVLSEIRDDIKSLIARVGK